VIAPAAPAWDREHRFPREVFGQLGRARAHGRLRAREHGGAGADFLSYVLVLEELSRGDAGVGTTLAVHLGAGICRSSRTLREQIERLVPPLARGTRSPPSRSPSRRGLRRERDAHARRRRPALTGAKQWITNGSHARTFTSSRARATRSPPSWCAASARASR
jgi:alkylation response protein AidB-like acyl-CoA dehydrogenase